MTLYQVTLINNEGTVVYAGATEASSPNEAIEKERKFAQLPYCKAQCWTFQNEHNFYQEPELLLEKHSFASLGDFRMVA